jgi:hypothetical protein
MATIPKRVIHIWGYKDTALSLKATAARQAAQKHLSAEWSSLLLLPADILNIAQHHIPDTELRSATVQFLENDQGNWARRADVARTVAVYGLGGLYLDLDVIIERNLDVLCEPDIVLCRSAWKQEVEADVLGARAHDARILDLIRRQMCAVLNRNGPSNYTGYEVVSTTGPVIFTNWAQAQQLTPADLVSRWIVVTKQGPCKAPIAEHFGEVYGQVSQVDGAFFTAYQSLTWYDGDPRRPTSRLTAPVVCKVFTEFSTWNKGQLQPTGDVAIPPSISMAAVCNVIDKANTVQDVKMGLLNYLSSGSQDVLPIARVQDLKEERTKRESIAGILRARVTDSQRKKLLAKVTQEPAGKLVRLVLDRLWKSRSKLTAPLKKWLHDKRGG